MKDKVNVLFVCGYGVGSSAMSASLVQRGLNKLNVRSEVDHTAAGEVQSFTDWVDIVAVSKAFVDVIGDHSNYKAVIEVENIMDGDGIAAEIYEIVKDKYPEAITK